MFEPMVADDEPAAVIKVIGVGGGGGNAVEHMIAEHIEGVEFFAANTDAQALKRIKVGQTIQIGTNVTKGLGAGANPEVGRNSAEEDRDVIRSAIEGADMVFIAAGMGGGTGTGAAPVVAEIAKELGILTVAVVTKPFGFEGKKRMAFAEQGISELAKHVDSLITIPNDKLLKVLGRGVKLLDAFAAANGVLKGAVQGIAELITKPGLINVDFADVRTVMSEMGYAMMGSGRASGDNRAEEAAEMAISSPLLEDIDLSGARGVLVNVTSGFDIGLEEFETVGNTVKAFASDNATVVVGSTFDPDISDEIRVTVVATGIGMDKRPEVKMPKPVSHNELFSRSSPLGQQEDKLAKVVNEPIASPLDNREILDIPAFIRKQAN
ncbi:MAG: cell division protein FtsZ [Gilliamella sp.]|uniref:cell division protein FtsZ n=1 Tax=unclassified Gilliamella TaxID=2685620 RepID=UPI0015810818|nr:MULTISPECIES: cell division protein FtsZ [unclassified Gilliamella]MCO6536703.1 cell division protein FtsZ [Gilliamella sp.]MCO6538628.1 cell division protein FtsZ [Gilliamella sp.]MCO6553394.1 cell division protein FtsZ [Gilliamella sp.]MCO6560587.1 cell division protein FtsZ [Gilliamella sp.]NUE95870.1 cell division protein FtsZ [Gilliamella sp. ESL0232]